MHDTTFSFQHTYRDFTSLGAGHCTAALCRCDPPVLFDPGVSVYGPRCLQALQRCATAAPIIALTHSHFDHCGAAAYLLRCLPEAVLAAGRRAATILQRPNAVALIARLCADYEQREQDQLGGADVSFTALHVNRPLADGDTIELAGGRCVQVLETPGHTRDSLSYFLPDTGIVVTGDAAGACENDFIHSPFLTGYDDYVRSIDTIAALHPAALCIAHNGILAGEAVPRYLDRARTAAEAHKALIEQYLDACNGDCEQVVRLITDRQYDAGPVRLQNRGPYILNLRATVAAVAASR